LLCSRLNTRIDQRKIIAGGLVLLGLTLHDMSGWTPDIDGTWLVAMMVVQGFAMGCIWNPVTVVSFSTLPAHLRGDAAAVQSLGRNIGAAIGISVTAFLLVHSMQVSHAGLSAGITPFLRELPGYPLADRLLDPATHQGAALLERMIAREAMIIAYSNDFLLMSLVAIPSMALVFMMRHVTAPTGPAGGPAGGPAPTQPSGPPGRALPASPTGAGAEPARAAAAPSR